MYNCESCNKKFNDKNIFLSHMDICDDDILSVTSDMSYSSHKSSIGYIKNKLEKYKNENNKLIRRIKELDIHYNGIISKIKNNDTGQELERQKFTLEKIISDLHTDAFDKDQLVLKLNREINNIKVFNKQTKNDEKKHHDNLEYKNIIKLLEDVIKKLKYKINVIEEEKNVVIKNNNIAMNNNEKKFINKLNIRLEGYNKKYKKYINEKDVEIENIILQHNITLDKINKKHKEENISRNILYKKLINNKKIESEKYIIHNRENDRMKIEKLLIKETLLNKRHNQKLNKINYENEKINNNYYKHLEKLNNVNKKLENEIKLKIQDIEKYRITKTELTYTINTQLKNIQERTEKNSNLQNTIEYMSRVIKTKHNEIELQKNIKQEYIDKETKLLISTNQIQEQKIQLKNSLSNIKNDKNILDIENKKYRKELANIRQSHFKEILSLKNEQEKINKDNKELTINNNLLKSRYIQINKELDNLKNIKEKYDIQDKNIIEKTVILETIKNNNNTLTLNIKDKEKIIVSNNLIIKNLNSTKIQLESDLDTTHKRLQSCETLLNSLVRDKSLLTGRINDLLTKIPR